jgi:hypothetical protein
MRDLIEKFCNMGYAVEFSEEQGYPVIRIFKGSDRSAPIESCSLGTGTFRSAAEETLQAMLLKLERK